MSSVTDKAAECGENEFKEMELLVDGVRGIYAPRHFAERHGKEWSLSKTDMDILLAGPDHEYYWETWDDVWTNAMLGRDGKTWHLHCDMGDIFMVAHAE